MPEIQQQRIVQELLREFQFRQQGEWLQQGLCPQCGKRQLFANAVNPVMATCNRRNNCGFESHVKELLPELYADFNKTYAPTKENPNRTANAYMEMQRALNPVRLRGNWVQETYYHPHGNKPTATVRFAIADGVFMERFTEAVTIKEPGAEPEIRKQNIKGKYKGLAWQPHGQIIGNGDTVYITEAIIDALSFVQNGFKAIASLSTTNFPEKTFTENKGKDVDWVWAFDGDIAGETATRKMHSKLENLGENSRAILPKPSAQKKDWNDYHQANQLKKDLLKDFEYYGNLCLAKTSLQKAILIWQHKKYNGFDFRFRGRTYWFEYDHTKFMAYKQECLKQNEWQDDDDLEEHVAKTIGSIKQIMECTIDFLYYQKNQVTDESWYYSRIKFPHKGKPIKNTFKGAQLITGVEFAKRLIDIAPGAVFDGDSQNLRHIIKRDLFKIKTVETVDYIGYSPGHEAYIFGETAVKQNSVYTLNSEDYFQIGDTSVKTLLQAPALNIGKEHDYDDSWTYHLGKAYGEKGVIALAFWIGSLFTYQIKSSLEKTWPFMEIVGDAGAGKSTLIQFLWKLVGRAIYEGFDANKATTAARARIFSQVSNLPVVLSESDQDDHSSNARKFDWAELKDLYGLGTLRPRGVKNNGNETYEPPFRGSIAISQNYPVEADEAIMQRICQIHFSIAENTEESYNSAVFLEKQEIKNISYFIVKMLKQEKAIMDYYGNAYKKYFDALLALDGVGNVRIARNHAQLKVFTDIAAKEMKLSEPQKKRVHSFIDQMAIKRMRTLNSDHEVVQQFWEAYRYLTEEKQVQKFLNHSKKTDLIAISLNEFEQFAREAQLSVPDKTSLQKHLRNSSKYKFIDTKPVSSSIREDKTVHCWVFEAPKDNRR